MAMLLNDQWMMMMMMMMMLAIATRVMVVVSIGSPDDAPQVMSMVEAGTNNGTELRLLLEERNDDVDGGRGDVDRSSAKCSMSDKNSDLLCTYVCLPHLGDCKVTPPVSKANCVCSEPELYEKVTCDQDDECKSKLEDDIQCKCLKNKCYCEMHKTEKDYALLSETSLIYASLELCNEHDGSVKVEACPENMVAFCLLLLDAFNQLVYQYHCMFKANHKSYERGFMTLIDANRIYVPAKSNQHLMTDALFVHSVCALTTTCPETQIGYLGFSKDKKPFCMCVALDGSSPKIQKKVPVPCRVGGKLENLAACKKTCKNIEYGHCDLVKGQPAFDCHCTNAFKHAWGQCKLKLGPKTVQIVEKDETPKEKKKIWPFRKAPKIA